MCCRVKKAFVCFTLEGFGIFDAWMSIIVCTLGILLSVRTFLSSFDVRSVCYVMLNLFGLIQSKRFIDAIKQVVFEIGRDLQNIMAFKIFQRDDSKMISYIILKLLVTSIALAILGLAVIPTQSSYVKDMEDRQYEDKIFRVVVALIAEFELYSFVCLISLNLKIMDDEDVLPLNNASNNGVLVSINMNPQNSTLTNPPEYQPPPDPTEQNSNRFSNAEVDH